MKETIDETLNNLMENANRIADERNDAILLLRAMVEWKAEMNSPVRPVRKLHLRRNFPSPWKSFEVSMDDGLPVLTPEIRRALKEALKD